VLRAEADRAREQSDKARANETLLRQQAEAAEKIAQAARRHAEAGQTALLYWQAFNALPDLNGMGTNPEPAALAARYDKVFKLLGHAARMRSGCDWAANPADGPEMPTPPAWAVRQIAEAARLRAQVALQEGRPESASQDLFAEFVLFRNLAEDGTLRDVMLQTVNEIQTVEFVAKNFNRFTAEDLTKLAQGIENAPPHVEVNRCVDAEKVGWPEWLIRRAQETQTAAAGDEAEALSSVRMLLCSAMGLEDSQANDIILASGGSSLGVIEYAKEAIPFYELMKRVATESPEHLAAETDAAARLIEGNPNLMIKIALPNFGKARGRELEALTQLAMLRAAVCYKQQGLSGLNTVRDPFADGQFILRRVEHGFELHSTVERYGLAGSQTFVEEDTAH